MLSMPHREETSQPGLPQASYLSADHYIGHIHLYDTPANAATVYSRVKPYEQQQPSIVDNRKPTARSYQRNLTRPFIGTHSHYHNSYVTNQPTKHTIFFPPPFPRPSFYTHPFSFSLNHSLTVVSAPAALSSNTPPVVAFQSSSVFSPSHASSPPTAPHPTLTSVSQPCSPCPASSRPTSPRASPSSPPPRR